MFWAGLLIFCVVMIAVFIYQYQRQFEFSNILIAEKEVIVPINTQSTQSWAIEINSDTLWNLAVELGDNFGLDEVQMSKDGDYMVVWFRAPTISDDQFNEGLAQALGYLDLRMPDEIKKYRLVFIIDGVDSAYIEVNRSTVAQWRDGIIDNIQFIETFKKVAL
jgi:hypothetical protein